MQIKRRHTFAVCQEYLHRHVRFAACQEYLRRHVRKVYGEAARVAADGGKSRVRGREGAE